MLKTSQTTIIFYLNITSRLSQFEVSYSQL